MTKLLNLGLAALWLLGGSVFTTALSDEGNSKPDDRWASDYSESLASAKHRGLNLLILFQDPTAERPQVLDSAELTPLLDAYVRVQVPPDAIISLNGEPVKLLDHPAFAEMLRQSGVAILDFTHPDQPYYGRVVSAFPRRGTGFFSLTQLQAMFALPPGTITQRTMVYAVMTHPERPQSVQGAFDPVLAAEAASHSDHQATITLQGHHNWDARFQRINGNLGNGLLATEVCAESWPGKTLVDACEDCVWSWRQSPGHWDAVKQQHPRYAFDIARGRNGIWYATGVFGSSRTWALRR